MLLDHEVRIFLLKNNIYLLLASSKGFTAARSSPWNVQLKLLHWHAHLFKLFQVQLLPLCLNDRPKLLCQGLQLFVEVKIVQA